MQKKTYESPMDAALSYLTARMRTEGEIREKMRSLGYSEEDIEPVILRLRELRFVDDEAYAKEYLRSRTAAKPVSRAALKYQLQKHKVAKEQAEQALETIGREEELTACRAAGQQAWRTKSSLPAAERKQKVFAKLCRAGFDMETVMSVCRELAAGEEEESDF